MCLSAGHCFLLTSVATRKIFGLSVGDREGTFLLERISVLLHRFNSILLVSFSKWLPGLMVIPCTVPYTHTDTDFDNLRWRCVGLSSKDIGLKIVSV